MTRIVAGAAKGRRLQVPARGTRPTSERAREALFNSLRSLVDLDGARVLDLFAGSGAVGLEALSRGAAAVLLVESDARAAAVARANIDAVGLPGAQLHRRPVEAFLAAGPAGTADAPDAPGRSGSAAIDLAFLDPPYDLSAARLAAVLDRLVGGGWLAPEAVVVVERAAQGAEVGSDSPQPPWPAGVTPLMRRRYGAGVLWYGRAR